MYFDRRLWGLTKGVRLRIAGAVAVGLLAAAAGVGRLALLGWLLALVFRGEPLEALTVPFAGVAGVMLLRGVLDYWRNMVAHRTAALVQLHLRQSLYAFARRSRLLAQHGDRTAALVQLHLRQRTRWSSWDPPTSPSSAPAASSSP